MTKRWFDPDETRRHGLGRGGDDPSRDRLLAVGIVVAAAVAVASALPPALFAAVLSELLFLCALATLFLAMLREDRLWNDEVTAWDQSALLAAAALLAGMFVDAQAVATVIGAADWEAAS